MPASKRIFTSDELRVLYDRGRSAAVVDEYHRLTGGTVGRSTVCKWLRAAGIEAAHYSPYTQKRLDSPFSAARLHELYWKAGKSLSEIAALAAPLMGLDRPPYQKTVTRWLAGAGVTLRTAAESQSVRARLHPEQWATPVAEMQAALAAHPEKRVTCPQGPGAVVRRHGQAAAAAKKRAERPWETRECQWPDCRRAITKPVRMFRHRPERTYCSVSCASRHMHWRRYVAAHPL